MNGDVKWSLTFRYIAATALFAAVIAFLIYAHTAVRVLAIAAFVAYLINPAVAYLTSHNRISRPAAVNVVFFSALILLVGIPATLAPIFYDEVQVVIKDLLGLTAQIQQMLENPIRLGGIVFRLNELGASLFQLQNNVLSPLPGKALQLLESTSINLLWFLVTVVSTYFFLSQWPNMRQTLFSFAPEPYRPELHELYKRIRWVWMAYLRGQIVLMLIVGVVFTVAWIIIGIPGALVLGVIAGLFTLVPDVGPFLAAGIAAAVALLEGSTWIPLSNFWVAGIVVLTYLVLIGLKNFFLRPLVMGRSVHMNEALVFIIIMVATVLEGILGALLIVPLYASTVVVVQYMQKKILGLPPFIEGNTQFVMPEEKAAPPVLKWGRRSTDRLEDAPAEVVAALKAGQSQPQRNRRSTDRNESVSAPTDGPSDPAAISSQGEPASIVDDEASSIQMPAHEKE